MLIPQVKQEYRPEEKMEGGRLDQEAYLSLTLIRDHTKTNDIIAVSDEQLALYRDAALEAAEKYTGLLIRERRVVTESVRIPENRGGRFYRKPWIWHRTKLPFSQPVAYYYGHNNQEPIQIPVVVGENIAKLPWVEDDFGIGCCNPCKQEVQARLMYVAGYDCKESIPAAIKLGALKYIAHVVQNPGDIAYANTPSGSKGDQAAVDKTSNPAYASGAIEIWRSAVDDAI